MCACFKKKTNIGQALKKLSEIRNSCGWAIFWNKARILCVDGVPDADEASLLRQVGWMKFLMDITRFRWTLLESTTQNRAPNSVSHYSNKSDPHHKFKLKTPDFSQPVPDTFP